MGLSIEETKNGFKINKRSYLYGDGLIELANSDFSKLFSHIHSDISSYDRYIDFLLPIFQLKIKSIYFKLLQNNLISFLDKADGSDGDIPFQFKKIEDNESFMQSVNNLFSPLFTIHKRITTLFTYLDLNNTDFKGLSFNERISKFQEKYDFEHILKLKGPRIIKNSFLNDLSPNSSIQIITDNNKFKFKYSFYNVEDLFEYELINFLKNPLKIIECKHCKKYAKINRVGREYCNSKCKNNYNRVKLVNRDCYYLDYDNTRKNLHLNLDAKNPEDKLVFEELKKLYDYYRKYVSQTESNQKKFKKELDLFKLKYK